MMVLGANTIWLSGLPTLTTQTGTLLSPMTPAAVFADGEAAAAEDDDVDDAADASAEVATPTAPALLPAEATFIETTGWDADWA
jgi:hypothetical protein